MIEEEKSTTSMKKHLYSRTQNMAAFFLLRFSYLRQRPTVTTTALIILLIAAVTVLLVWLVYRPVAPTFTIVDAAVLDVHTTTSPNNSASATIHFTVAAYNPNRRVAVYYDRMTAYAVYRNEAITPQVELPDVVQGHRSTEAVVVRVGGEVVPVSPGTAAGLGREGAYGVVGLRLVLLGRLRWKAGAIRSGWYGLYVKCEVMVGVKKGKQVPLLGGNLDCYVEI